jgi:hypothetical protein
MDRKRSAQARACAAHCIIAEGERLQVITLFLIYRCHLLKHIASTTAYALQEGKRNVLRFNVQATFKCWMLFYKQKWTKTIFTLKGQECAGVYHSCSCDDYISIHSQYHVKLHTLYCIKLQNLDGQTMALHFMCCHDNTHNLTKTVWSAFYIPHNSLVIEAQGANKTNIFRLS